MPEPLSSLSVIVPCFNQRETLRAPFALWHQALSNCPEIGELEFIVVNDGSNDGTGRVIDLLRKEFEGIRVVHQLRMGKNKAARRGYEEARMDFVFQLDLEGNYDPQDFLRMWENRLDYPFILGARAHRFTRPLHRLLSRMLKTSLRHLFHVELEDPNVPFRLFQRTDIQPYLRELPQSWETINLTLALLIKRDFPYESLQIAIPTRPPLQGKPHESLGSLARRGRQTARELLSLRFRLAPPTRPREEARPPETAAVPQFT